MIPRNVAPRELANAIGLDTSADITIYLTCWQRGDNGSQLHTEAQLLSSEIFKISIFLSHAGISPVRSLRG